MQKANIATHWHSRPPDVMPLPS